MTFWLSFADGSRSKGSQFLGVCIVDAPDFLAAIQLCHKRGINPGGEVQGGPLPFGVRATDAHKNRLLTRAEAEEADNLLSVGDA